MRKSYKKYIVEISTEKEHQFVKESLINIYINILDHNNYIIKTFNIVKKESNYKRADLKKLVKKACNYINNLI